MNKSRLCFPFGLLLLFVMLAGCFGNNPDDKASDADILKKNPFGPVTDSIRLFPGQAGLYFRRAELLSQTNNHILASLDYKKAWELDPTEDRGIQYAANLSILGKPAEKLALLQDGAKRFPTSLNFHRLMGETYAESGKPREALALYDSMLKQDSADFETWYEKGILMESLHDTAAAISALKMAFKLQPVNTYALELAHLYAESGNALALRICNDVIRNGIPRELTDPYFIKGIYYSNMKQYDQAILEFDTCIRKDWKSTDAYIEKGIAFFKQKNLDDALNTFRMAATVSNTNPDAYFWIGRCYETLQKKDEALVNYERAAALDKNFTEARDAIARLQDSVRH